MTNTPTLWTTARDFAAVVAMCIVGALALFALIHPARAEGPPQRGYDYYERESPRPAWLACEPDVQRYCPRVAPGGGRILSCLAGNKDRLSPACHDLLWRAWAYRR